MMRVSRCAVVQEDKVKKIADIDTDRAQKEETPWAAAARVCVTMSTSKCHYMDSVFEDLCLFPHVY